MQVFDSDSYQDYIKFFLETSPRGTVRKLADALGCHPTFISQVVSQKANFSNEQAVHFCRFAKLDAAETEYFIDLVGRDRAGDADTKAFFASRLERHAESRLELQSRWKTKDVLRPEHEYVYFENYLYQAIHCLIQVPTFQDSAALAKALAISKEQADSVLFGLNKMGLAERAGSRWSATKASLHIGKSSPNTRRFHMNWRLKTAALLLDQQPESNLHFSAVAAISRREAAAIRRALVDVIDSSRQRMVDSKSEEVFVLNLDYYPLVKE
ncbi:MAG TPA: TIGR02147 family protein [Bdellovibrionales bacterium]|nr:TIGR02147 family protein [Bdellovibrionales bacterium]